MGGGNDGVYCSNERLVTVTCFASTILLLFCYTHTHTFIAVVKVDNLDARIHRIHTYVHIFLHRYLYESALKCAPQLECRQIRNSSSQIAILNSDVVGLIFSCILTAAIKENRNSQLRRK